MEPVIAGIVGGVVLAAALLTVVWKVVSAAVDNGLDWLIETFGNEDAREDLERRRQERSSSHEN